MMRTWTEDTKGTRPGMGLGSRRLVFAEFLAAAGVLEAGANCAAKMVRGESRAATANELAAIAVRKTNLFIRTRQFSAGSFHDVVQRRRSPTLPALAWLWPEIPVAA